MQGASDGLVPTPRLRGQPIPVPTPQGKSYLLLPPSRSTGVLKILGVSGYGDTGYH